MEGIRNTIYEKITIPTISEIMTLYKNVLLPNFIFFSPPVANSYNCFDVVMWEFLSKILDVCIDYPIVRHVLLIEYHVDKLISAKYPSIFLIKSITNALPIINLPLFNGISTIIFCTCTI